MTAPPPGPQGWYPSPAQYRGGTRSYLLAYAMVTFLVIAVGAGIFALLGLSTYWEDQKGYAAGTPATATVHDCSHSRGDHTCHAMWTTADGRSGSGRIEGPSDGALRVGTTVDVHVDPRRVSYTKDAGRGDLAQGRVCAAVSIGFFIATTVAFLIWTRRVRRGPVVSTGRPPGGGAQTALVVVAAVLLLLAIGLAVALALG